MKPFITVKQTVTILDTCMLSLISRELAGSTFQPRRRLISRRTCTSVELELEMSIVQMNLPVLAFFMFSAELNTSEFCLLAREWKYQMVWETCFICGSRERRRFCPRARVLWLKFCATVSLFSDVFSILDSAQYAFRRNFSLISANN